MKYQPPRTLLYGLDQPGLAEHLSGLGQPPFRARQLADWIYRKRVRGFDQMANLPRELRERLAGTATLRTLKPVLVKRAGDTTRKILFQLDDGRMIETVLIEAPEVERGNEEAEATPGRSGRMRRTVCISTQVGCAYGCKFCASGLDGWKRDLLAGEIAEQLVWAADLAAGREIVGAEIAPNARADEDSPALDREALLPIDNIVVMGMGEPLANYDALLRALGNVNADWGFNFGARRITVSTSGLVPQIRRLASEPIQFRLAISLHGATNEVREQIMPINRKYPLEELLDAARYFNQHHGRMLTLEYILIEGINDTLDQARELGRIATSLHAHVNLIPYNRVEGLDWKRPGIARQDRFVRELRGCGARCTIRREKGHDIAAACGQLRLKNEHAADAA